MGYNCIFDQPRSGVVYNFGHVCPSVCLDICQTITTFESLEVGSSYLHIRYISRKYGSSSYMKIIGSRSRSQEQKKVKHASFCNVKVLSAITPLLQNTAMKFACSMGFLDTADRMVQPQSLPRDRK